MNKTMYTLDNINFTFEKGKKYALVGKSGSGKSTLLKLISGYYDDYEGSLKFDYSEIYDIERNSLYSEISLIHQNTFLIDDTIKNNITLFEDYSLSEYENAILKSNLSEVIESLPNKSETKIGEDGILLSGGQKQRISIARAIIKGSNILLLDESTSSLDSQTAFEIENELLSMDNITIIYSTHKYNKETFKKFDCILVLNNGKLVETGTFDDLINSKKHFYSLYQLGNS